MEIVNMYNAKTHFSELIKKAMIGEEIIIAKAGKPLVKLVPVENTNKRTPGSGKDEITIEGDFNAPLPDDIQESFYQ